MKKSIALLAGSALFVAISPAAAVTFTAAQYQQAKDGLTAMRGLNLIVLGSMTGGHDIEGKAYVGGSIGGSKNFTAGIGAAANGQSAAANDFATLTVGGNIGIDFNLNNGVNASNNYGVTVGGNTQGFTLNGDGAKVRIGGNVNVSELTLKSAGQNGAARAADVSIGGYVRSVVANAAGSTIKVGSLDSNGKVQAGDNATVRIVSGNVQDVKVGANSTVQTGGSITNTLEVGANTSATVSGNVGNNLNLSSGDTIRIGGQFQSQNVNGLQTGTTVAVSGANRSQNQAPTGWTFNTGLSYAAPAAPDAPLGPDGIALGTITATLTNNLATLSSVLGSLTPLGTITVGANQPVTPLNYSGATNNFAVFAMSENAFEDSGINFDTLFANTPVGMTTIINVAGSSLVQGGNNNYSGGNQKVIWNFYEASSVSTKGFHGSILAVNATLSNSSAIEGSVVAKSFNQNGEVHLGTFNGTSAFLKQQLIPAVPEPGTWMQMIAGFGVVGFGLRRRNRIATVA